MKHKYTEDAQGEWIHTRSDWETKRRNEFGPSVAIIAVTVAFCIIGFHILDGMADWFSGIGV